MLGEPSLVMLTALLPLAVLPFCRPASQGPPETRTGSHPAVWLMEEGAHGEVLSIAFAGEGQHQAGDG